MTKLPKDFGRIKMEEESMKPTLQERLTSEAKEKIRIKYDLRYFDGSTYAVGEEFQKDLNQIILHTIEQTIKEGCAKIQSMKDIYGLGDALYESENDYNQALTDTQHALRGIIK